MRVLKKTLFKKEVFFVFLITIIAFFIRHYNLRDNFIFGYDQTRDALRIYSMIKEKDIKLVGQETDIPGVFHGPLTYYLMLPFYYFSNFDPNIVVYLFLISDLINGIIIYYSAKIIFNNKIIAFLSLFTHVFSYISISYSRFISNASLLPLGINIFYLGAILFFLKKKKVGLLVLGLGLGLAINFNFLAVYLILLTFVYFYYYKKKVFLGSFLIFIIPFIILMSPFIIADVKWNFIISKSLLNFLINNSLKEDISLINFVNLIITKLTEFVYYTFFSFNFIIAFVFLIFIISYPYISKVSKNLRKRLFLLYFPLFIHVFLLSFKVGVANSPWILSGCYLPLTLLANFFLFNFFKINTLNSKWFFLMLFIFFVSNLNLIVKDKELVKIFSIQRILLKDVKAVVNYISSNEVFSICSVSNPLFYNTNWAFAFKILNKRNNIVFWSGPKQETKSYLPYDKNHVKLRFLIIEPLGGIPNYAKKATLYKEDQISKLIEEKRFGDIIVQKRILTKNTNELVDTQNLSPQEKIELEKIIRKDYRYSCFHNYD